jgi:hypothetical protein
MIREDEAAARETPAHPQSAEQLAQLFHETYERLALEFGYRTREASAKPWADVPAKNKALMIAVCAEIVKYVIEPELARLQVAQKLAEQQHRAAINELEEFRSDCIRLRVERDGLLRLFFRPFYKGVDSSGCCLLCQVAFFTVEELRNKPERHKLSCGLRPALAAPSDPPKGEMK